MKKILAISIIIFCIACNKDSTLDKYEGNYSGQKVVITHYKDYDSIFHQFISKAKYDTTVCQLQIIPDCNKFDIKEFNENNTLIKYWHGIEVNNIGELAYFNPDTVGYGQIDIDSFSFHLTFPYTLPQDAIIETSDTLFYSYFFNATR